MRMWNSSQHDPSYKILFCTWWRDCEKNAMYKSNKKEEPFSHHWIKEKVRIHHNGEDVWQNQVSPHSHLHRIWNHCINTAIFEDLGDSQRYNMGSCNTIIMLSNSIRLKVLNAEPKKTLELPKIIDSDQPPAPKLQWFESYTHKGSSTKSLIVTRY